ncbi:MAG TPA: multiheme c-type cytochrome [Acidobacteriota bacterium]|nr:multiheme c-type cytochrome [Acidobacteriota bacterium]
MKKLGFLIILICAGTVFIVAMSPVDIVNARQERKLSDESSECIECHRYYTPGIVADWRDSRHSTTSPAEAMKADELERRISAEEVPEELQSVAVGCYECHSRNTDRHADAFEHEGFEINVVVSPDDCATCHPLERDEYAGSKKGHAVGNLLDNPIYMTLVNTSVGVAEVVDGGVHQNTASEAGRSETCFSCHGTVIEVNGKKIIESDYGELEVPDLSNWPNQGVGRVNPDGSRGSCAACHPRHGFSIETARKPFTCLQCHLNPDVPGWETWRESKHGNIFLSKADEWEWNAVPWTVGEDFRAPTCAACHNALLVNSEGEVVAERSHDFGARLYVRIFGLIYSHPHPKSGETSVIKNSDGLPLPTTFTGVPASEFLIDNAEQARRKAVLRKVCTACHSGSWADGHFEQLELTIAETDKMVETATKLMVSAWQAGLAKSDDNPFDEGLERKWIEQWLFYANSVRYGSAMGGPDYSAFKNGWYYLTKNLQDMKDAIALKQAVKK